jgi:hypothetical protein
MEAIFYGGFYLYWLTISAQTVNRCLNDKKSWKIFTPY